MGASDAEDGQPPLSGPAVWIRTKGCAECPNYRSGWVAQEFRTTPDNTLYAARPPLESIREVVSDVASSGDDQVVVTIDVRRAYFYAPATREVYVELPAEETVGHTERMRGKLLTSVHGTRDAAANWDAERRTSLEEMGSTIGSASPVNFHRKSWKAAACVNGYDIVAIIARGNVQKLIAAVSK